MANIRFENVAKVYPNGVRAVDNFCMEIKDKEFIVFVGPSGCGKSTTLRMIAGLEDITEGEISIDGVVVNNVEPKNRNIAMVFQNYALYPHMTVYNNMAFGLRLRKVPFAALEKNGEPILTVDADTLKKYKMRMLDLMSAQKTYKKIKDQANYDRITLNIAETKKLIFDEKKKVESAKATYKKYVSLRAAWLKLLKEYSKTPSDELKGKVDEAKEKLDANKGGLVPLYKYKHYDKKEIDRRIQEAGRILGITDYFKRKPKAMSGGQRQRVALGRCIVREPKVFLLDEPLSNLDAKLRSSMRMEISKLHKKLNTTFIYVTHDQVEAMTMGTRIVVMKDGFIQQIDSPSNLYNKPCNKFVAGFIGSPQMNFYRGKISRKDGVYELCLLDAGASFTAQSDRFAKIPDKYFNGEKEVVFGIRSEHLSIAAGSGLSSLKAKVSYVEELGVNSQIYVDFDLNNNESIDLSQTRGIIRYEPECNLRSEDIIDVIFDVNKIFVFDGETEISLL